MEITKNRLFKKPKRRWPSILTKVLTLFPLRSVCQKPQKWLQADEAVLHHYFSVAVLKQQQEFFEDRLESIFGQGEAEFLKTLHPFSKAIHDAVQQHTSVRNMVPLQQLKMYDELALIFWEIVDREASGEFPELDEFELDIARTLKSFA